MMMYRSSPRPGGSVSSGADGGPRFGRASGMAARKHSALPVNRDKEAPDPALESVQE